MAVVELLEVIEVDVRHGHVRTRRHARLDLSLENQVAREASERIRVARHLLPQKDRADAHLQLRHRKGLDHVVVRPGAETIEERAFVLLRGEHQDRKTGAVGGLPYGMDESEPVEDRHHEVGDDEIRLPRGDLREALGAVARHEHGGLLLEGLLEERAQCRVVLDHENAGWEVASGRARCRAGRGAFLRGAIGYSGHAASRGLPRRRRSRVRNQGAFAQR